jgi:glycosyltransferase involved in cell wall biosynthesis
MMRICYISNPNSPHTHRWVKWFARRGHSVCLVADTRVQEPPDGIPLFNLPARFNLPVVKYLAWIRWTRQIIQAWKPDILHAHRVTGGGWLGAFANFHPLVVTPWGSDLYLYPQRSVIAGWLTRRVLQQADLVTTDSADLRQQAVRFGADPEHASLVLWGVDSTIFHPPDDASALRRRLGIAGAPVILSPRAINRVYNLDVLVDAIPTVLSQYPQASFVLRDYNADSGYRDELKRQIANLNVGEHVVWAGPLLRWEDSAQYYQAADLVVSVPSSDATPVSILEAMACGIPIIASDLPSLREWITNGENGLLVPIRDANILAGAIQNLLGDERLRLAFRQRNLELVQERATHQAQMEKMERLYQDLLTSWRKASS